MVPVLLQEPIAFAVRRPSLAILTPVLGMLMLPAVLAVALVGPVIRIGGQFGTLPLRFPGALTNLVGAETLGLDPGIRQKMTATMGTSTGAVHGSLLSEAINLAKPLQQEEEELQPKEMRKGKQLRDMRETGKKHDVVNFLSGAPGLLSQR
jgi:hypothetical protein